MPSDANATAPTTGPPLVFHDTTGFVSLSRSIAHTAFGAPPQPADVAAYSVVPTAIGEDHRAFAGRNGAGRWMSLPDGQTKHVQHAVARDHVADAGGPEEEAEPPPAFLTGGDPGMRSGPAGRRARRPVAGGAGSGPHRAAARRRAAAAWTGGAAAASRAAARFDRHALPGLAEQGAIPTAPRPPPNPGQRSADRPSSLTMRVAPALMPPGQARASVPGSATSKCRSQTT